MTLKSRNNPGGIIINNNNENNIKINRYTLERVDDFECLGTLLNSGNGTHREIRQRIKNANRVYCFILTYNLGYFTLMLSSKLILYNQLLNLRASIAFGMRTLPCFFWRYRHISFYEHKTWENNNNNMYAKRKLTGIFLAMNFNRGRTPHSFSLIRDSSGPRETRRSV